MSEERYELNKERFDFLKYAYEAINSDLKFAETKNTFLTTFNLAIVGAIISALFNGKMDLTNTSGKMFICFGLFILIATFIAVSSFLPLSKLNRFIKRNSEPDKKFMFYNSVFNNYERNNLSSYTNFQDDIKKYFKGDEEIIPFEEQLIKQIIDLSDIANTKFVLFSIALRVELVSIILLFAFFIIA